MRETHTEITEAQQLTSGAIQKGVPTDVFLRSRALVSWAETPLGKKKKNCLITSGNKEDLYKCEFSPDETRIYDRS